MIQTAHAITLYTCIIILCDCHVIQTAHAITLPLNQTDTGSDRQKKQIPRNNNQSVSVFIHFSLCLCLSLCLSVSVCLSLSAKKQTPSNIKQSVSVFIHSLCSPTPLLIKRTVFEWCVCHLVCSPECLLLMVFSRFQCGGAGRGSVQTGDNSLCGK